MFCEAVTTRAEDAALDATNALLSAVEVFSETDEAIELASTALLSAVDVLTATELARVEADSPLESAVAASVWASEIRTDCEVFCEPRIVE